MRRSKHHTPGNHAALCGLCLTLSAACGSDEKATPENEATDAGRPPVEADAAHAPPPDAASVDACVPTTCKAADRACGTLNDGCGSKLNCGEPCEAGSNEDAAPECVPTTCDEEGKNCGKLSDGCGKDLQCGECQGESECGEVVANVCGCPEDAAEASATRTARRARSSGFAGSTTEYTELYDVICETVADCASACTLRDGTAEMCGASECLDNFDGAKDCLPPPVWRNLEAIRFTSDDPREGVELTVVSHPYSDFLLSEDYKFEVPEAATVTGVTVELRKAGDTSVVDNSVRLLKGGVIGDAERSKPDQWTDDLQWVSYGGPEDLWGEELTPEDVNADDFGAGLSVLYTKTVGNTRAYVDQVRVTVHYSLDCGQ